MIISIAVLLLSVSIIVLCLCINNINKNINYMEMKLCRVDAQVDSLLENRRKEQRIPLRIEGDTMYGIKDLNGVTLTLPWKNIQSMSVKSFPSSATLYITLVSGRDHVIELENGVLPEEIDMVVQRLKSKMIDSDLTATEVEKLSEIEAPK